MVDFVAIDFETADRWPGSICQIGVAQMVSGKATATGWLVDPGRPFEVINTRIHGINAARVAGAPSFPAVHGDLFRILDGRLVASYTYFDRRALIAACEAAGLRSPDVWWLDICAIARDAWPELGNHKLRTVCAYLGISHDKAHDAQHDALVAGVVLLEALAALGLSLEQAKHRYAERLAGSVPPVDPVRVPVQPDNVAGEFRFIVFGGMLLMALAIWGGVALYAPSPAPALAASPAVKAEEDAQRERDRRQSELNSNLGFAKISFRRTKAGRIFASGVVENKNDFPVKDFKALCTPIAESGTAMAVLVLKLLVVVEPKKRKAFSEIELGHISPQAKDIRCNDLTGVHTY